MIYLDWAATAIPNQSALKKALEESFIFFANPSALHQAGKAAGERLEKARSIIAEVLGVLSEQIIFTSGGTESDYLPMLSLFTKQVKRGIVLSSIEHSAVTEQAKSMAAQGFEVITIPVNSKGFVEPETVISSITQNTAFISIMAVNNETGAIQPIKEIAQAVKEFRKGKAEIHFHVDAVQAFGKIPFELKEWNVHSASFSGHKIGAPRGTGFLYCAKPFNSFLRGGGQEKGIRSGTENLFGILAMEKCLSEIALSFDTDFKHAKELSAFLIDSLRGIEGVEIIPKNRKAEDDSFSPWIIQFLNKNLTGEILVRCLSEENIFISTGSACSSKVPSNRIASALKVPAELQKNITRVSIGKETSKEDLIQFIHVLKKTLNQF